MPIFARWRRLESLPSARGRDALPGVYELADGDKQIIYIGQSAKDVPNRIRQHLQKNVCVAEQLVYWRYAYSRMPQTEEADLIARYREKHGDIPPCNRATSKLRDANQRYSERSRG